MGFLTASDKQRIAEAIREVESGTSGELVTVIAGASDDYPFIPTLWAGMLALAVPGFLTLAHISVPFLGAYGAQIVCFLVLALLFRIRPIKMRLVPGEVKRMRASRVAREQFFLQNLHHTRDRTGVLLFVSVAEHYVEIIADKGINDVVKSDTWDRIVARFVAQVQAGRIADGFLDAVRACGEPLAAHFPVRPGDRNELPNHLVEI